MAAKPHPTAPTIPATPIDNVEESRAQRLQRQQSRFRDRGGIFVPTSRNTLVDILLGKASPIKKPRRSASLSPSKGRTKSNSEKPKSLVRATSVREENLRRSPRKQRRSSSVASGAGGAKPVSIVSSHSGSKALADARKASLEAVTRETPSNEGDNNSALVKGSSGKKTTASRRAKKANPSKAKAPKPTKKVAKPAENHKENEPRSKRTRANDNIFSADLRNGHSSEPKLTATVSSKASSTNPSNSKKTSRNIPTDEEYEEEGAPKGRRKKSAATKLQPSSSRRKSSSRPSVPSKPSRPRSGAPQLPDIMEEDEDEALSLPAVLSSRKEEIRHESTTRKKRLVSVEDSLTDPDGLPRKRTKSDSKDATTTKYKTKPTSKPQITSEAETPSLQRKRRRVVGQDEDADADADGNATKPAKRKKVFVESEKVDESPLKPKKVVAKSRSKSALKSQKPVAKKAPTKTAKRKENSVTLHSTQLEIPRAQVPPRKGLPKSILLRIQNSSAPHIVDDEPDPIDFLS